MVVTLVRVQKSAVAANTSERMKRETFTRVPSRSTTFRAFATIDYVYTDSAPGK